MAQTILENKIRLFGVLLLLSIITIMPQLALADVVFPSDAGVINVKDYGAKGDGITDDTASIQKAVSENLGKTEKGLIAIIYFPVGTYIVTNTILPKADSAAEGGWSSYLTLQGRHRDKSIIKLKDNAPGYGDKNAPKSVLFTASSCVGCGTNRDWVGKGEGNEAFNNNIFDLTVDTGKGNPGAIGIDYLASNNGAVRDVTIKSGDGNGKYGLVLNRKWPGPALIKNVLIEGFDYGISIAQTQYGMTFEHITLQNQKVAGIQNIDNVLSMRDLKSTNSVPVIQNTGSKGLVTLIDGSFTGGSSSASAIENDAGELFARNIAATGYKSAIKNKGSIIPGQSISEFVSNGPYSLFPSPKNSLNLPVKDPPEVPWDPLDKWVNVQDYGADGSGRKDFDNSPAVQKAIDEADKLGKTTLYFPKGTYAFGDTIHIRGNIRRVHFMMSRRGVVNSTANKFGDGRPAITVEEGKHPVVMIEGGGRGFNTGSTVRSSGFALKHVSSSTLVMRNMGGGYENVPGSGPVFFEDMQGCGIFRSTKVWARQLDPESCAKDPAPAIDPKILNDGSDIWILGLKTEKPATIIETKNGGRTEVLGGLLYPTEAVPSDKPAFINRDSSHSLSFVIKADNEAASHKIIVEETRGGETKQLTKSQVLPRGQGSMVPLYVGYIEGAPATPPPLAQCSDGLDNDADGLTDFPSDPGCTSSNDNDETNAPLPPSGSDSTPPVISNVHPQGILPASTKEVTISLQTNEPAQCAISHSPGLINQPNSKLFTTTGGTSHSITLPKVEKGKSYTLYARCKDKAGNITPEDSIIRFSIEKSEKASPLSKLLPIVTLLIIGMGAMFFIIRRLKQGKTV